MSTTIDERVVEMRFDNKNFEKNVQTSMNTLSSLKQSLKMDGATKGLENVDETARSVSFEKLLSGVESLQNRFSAFGIIGMRALENITDSMMNLAKKTISFLSNSIVQGGISRAMNLENAHFQLQGLLKDEDAVSAVMKNVNDSVDGTAYSLDSAAKVASQFAASGMRAGDDMFTSLRAVAGVAAMTNSEYDDMGKIFTTIAGNGRLMGDQLLQLSSRGLNAAATLKDFFNGVYNGSIKASDSVTKSVKEIMSVTQKNSEEELGLQRKALDDKYEQQRKAYENQYDQQRKALDKLYDQQKEAYNKEYTEKKKAYDKKYQALSDSLESEINAVEKANEKKYQALSDSLESEINDAEKANEKKLEKAKKSYEDDVSAYEKATEKKIALIDKEYNESLKLINEEKYRQIKAIDDEIDAINAKSEAEEKARELAERKNKRLELQKAIDSARSAEERQKAEKALADYNSQIAQKELQEERRAKIQSLKDKKENIKDEMELEKEAARKKHDNAINEVREESKNTLNAKKERYTSELKSLQESNAKKISEMRESAQKQLTALKDGQTKQLSKLREGQTEQLSVLKDSQAKQLEIYKETQNEKLAVLQKSINAQKAALTTSQDFTEITEADIRDLISKGKISFDIFSAAMDDAFGEHAKKANETFTGAISNIKAALARIGAGFISPLVVQNGALVKLFNTVRERVNDVKKSLVFDESIGNVHALSKQFTDFVTKIAESSTKYLSKLDLTKPFEAFYNILDSLKNTIKGFTSIVKPIIQGFRDIFPPVTMENIISFSKKFKELTSQFKLNEKDSKNLRSTFKGLFAIIDIGKQAIKAIISAILPAAPALGNTSSKILEVTGKIGEWIASLDNAIKKNNIFSNTIQKIKDAIGKFIKFITPAFETIKGVIKSGINSIKEFAKTHFSAPDTSGLDKFSDKIKEKFKPLNSIFEGLKKLFVGIWEFFKKLSPIFATLATHIGNALGGVGDAISNSLNGGGFKGILDLVNGGVLAAIGIGIKKFIDSLSNVTNSASGFIGSLKGIFNDVRGCLEAWQKNIKADILLKIAGAMAILTASLVTLSLIDSDKLTVGLTAITVLFADLFGSMAAFEKIMGGSGFKSVNKASSAMIKMSTAVLILSVAMKTIANVDQDSLNNALTAVTMLIADLTTSAIVLSKWGGKIQTSATGMILFAEAVNILSLAVKKLGELDYDVLKKGLIAVGVVMGELVAFMAGAKFGNFKTSQGLAIIELAAALLILQKAVSAFGNMDTLGMIQGLAAIAAVLAEIVVFTKLMGDSKKMITTATGITILGAAMLIFSNAVKGFAEMSWEELGKGLLGMGAALSMVAVAMNNMPAKTPIIAAGMVLVGASLKIISSAMKDFAGMTWEEISRGIVALAGSLAVISGVLILMKKTLSGAAALLIVAGALAILTPAIKTLGKMSLTEIGKSLLALAGAFGVIGIAGLLLGPIVPAILGLGTAVALLGVGALGCGVGLLSFSVGLTTLSVSGAAAIATLVLAIESIVSLIPGISIQIANGITALITTLGENAPQIISAVSKIVSSTLQMIRDTAPDLVETILKIVEKLLESLDSHLPTILKSLLSILITVLKNIRDKIGEITTIVIDIIVKTLQAIAKKLPDIIQAGIDIVVNLINGLAKGIEDNASRIRDAFINLFKSLIKAVLTFLGIHSPSTVFKDVGINIIKGLINGIGQMLASLLRKMGEILSAIVTAIKDKLGDFLNKGKEIMTNIKDGIANKISEVKSKVKEVITNCVTAIKDKLGDFLNKGKELMTNIKDGINNKLSAVKNAATSIVSKALSAIEDKAGEWTNIGKKLIEGLKNGMTSLGNSVVNGAKWIGGKAVDGLKKLFGIHSPSRVFAEIGMYCDKGLIEGLENGADDIFKASEVIGEQAVTGMTKTIKRLSDNIDLYIESDPTIKPVLDLSDIKNGSKDIDKMLYNKKSVELADNVNFAMNTALERNQNEKTKTYNDSGVISEIGKLREDINVLAGAITQMKLVMDTGTIVGALAGPMDSALGMRAKYGLRGN